MSGVQRIQEEIRALTPDELQTFREWFQEYDAAEWDKRIEEDALSGKLDGPAERALRDHQAARTTEL